MIRFANSKFVKEIQAAHKIEAKRRHQLIFGNSDMKATLKELAIMDYYEGVSLPTSSIPSEIGKLDVKKVGEKKKKTPFS